MNKHYLRSRNMIAIVAVLMSLGWEIPAWAAARAYTDVEADLDIVSLTPGSAVNFVGSGTSLADFGPVPAALGMSYFNRVRIAGSVPANGVEVPMSVGQLFEFDAQAEVVSGPLSTGQSAYNQIDQSGLMKFQNTGATDTTITFDFQREHRLYTFLDNPATEFAGAHKTFRMSAFTYSAAGLPIDSFPLLVNFDKQVQQGVLNASPSDHFIFNLFVPAGGSGTISMQTRALSEVALVPEPTSLAIVSLGCLLLVGRYWRHAPAKRGPVTTPAVGKRSAQFSI